MKDSKRDLQISCAESSVGVFKLLTSCMLRINETQLRVRRMHVSQCAGTTGSCVLRRRSCERATQLWMTQERHLALRLDQRHPHQNRRQTGQAHRLQQRRVSCWLRMKTKV